MKLNEIKDNIVFNEKAHRYDVYGEMYTGVSTLLNLISKDFLKPWAAKEAVKALGYFDKTDWNDGKPIPVSQEDLEAGWEAMKPLHERLKVLTLEEFWGALDYAKGAFGRSSKKATDVGSVVHYWLESHIAGTDRAIDDCAEHEGVKLTAKLRTQAENSINAFLVWERDKKPEWIFSELVMAYPELKIAGTTDFVARIDGEIVIGDFKTSGQISHETALQLAAYWMMFDRMLVEGEERPTKRLVVRIPKDGTEVQEWYVNTPLEFDIEVIKGLKALHQWKLYTDKIKL